MFSNKQEKVARCFLVRFLRGPCQAQQLHHQCPGRAPSWLPRPAVLTLCRIGTVGPVGTATVELPGVGPTLVARLAMVPTVVPVTPVFVTVPAPRVGYAVPTFATAVPVTVRLPVPLVAVPVTVRVPMPTPRVIVFALAPSTATLVIVPVTVVAKRLPTTYSSGPTWAKAPKKGWSSGYTRRGIRRTREITKSATTTGPPTGRVPKSKPKGKKGWVRSPGCPSKGSFE